MIELRIAVDALAALDPESFDNAALGELVADVTAQHDRLSAVRARLVAAHDRRQAWKHEGAHSEKEWLRRRCRLSHGEASGTTETAKRMAALPKTSAAWADGSISAEAAKIAARAAQDLPADERAGLDDLVADTAPGADPDELKASVDDYAHRVAPESLEAREQRAWRARRLDVRKAGDACSIEGRSDVLGIETLRSALGPLAAPSGPDDRRSHEQRMHDALIELAARSLDRGDLPATAGVRPHVSVVVNLDTLQGTDSAPPAQLDRCGALSGEQARMLACDAGITRVITKGASQPLDVGRETRDATVAQRRALAVRDGGCIGCGAPPGWCVAHHVDEWFRHDGPTDLHNLVLLCRGCHRKVHMDRWRCIRGPDGHWALDPPPPGPQPRTRHRSSATHAAPPNRDDHTPARPPPGRLFDERADSAGPSPDVRAANESGVSPG